MISFKSISILFWILTLCAGGLSFVPSPIKLPGPISLHQTPGQPAALLAPRATSTSYYPSFEDLYPSEPETKKPNLTPVIVLIPLIVGVTLMGGIFCVVKRCGKTRGDDDAPGQTRRQGAQQRQWGDCNRVTNRTADVDVEALSPGLRGGTGIRDAVPFVLRDENGVTVVEEAPPAYSLIAPR